jgi:hypothetical protein
MTHSTLKYVSERAALYNGTQIPSFRARRFHKSKPFVSFKALRLNFSASIGPFRAFVLGYRDPIVGLGALRDVVKTL